MEPAVTQIAIVDDDPSVGRALGRLVRSLGMKSETFLSGEAFLSALPQSGRPDCVVLDVQMPGMNGLEVQRRLIARQMSLPVIFITAHEDECVAQRAAAAGTIGFLSKPFSEGSFRELICRALNRQG